MHRLFVGIRPPAVLRRQMLDVMGGVPNARWQDDDQLHLTLRFIGEVDRHVAEDVATSLNAVHHPRFTLSLGELGVFERKGRAHTLWIRGEPFAHLRELQKKVDRALARVGFEPESRAFLPHITIARLGASAAPVSPFLTHTTAPVGSAGVTDFCLFESDLGRTGPTYSIISRYPLAE